MSDNIERRALSKAQLKHINQLRQEAQQAQGAVNRYIAYLVEEHEIPNEPGWILGPDGFEKKPEKATANGTGNNTQEA